MRFIKYVKEEINCYINNDYKNKDIKKMCKDRFTEEQVEEI